MTQSDQVKGNAPPLTIVQPGEREVTGDLGGIGVAFKLWGRDTNGMVSVVEHPIAVGAFVEPHLHTREDEYSIVTEGEIGFRSVAARWSSVPSSSWQKSHQERFPARRDRLDLVLLLAR
jgi:hypothetical protein